MNVGDNYETLNCGTIEILKYSGCFDVDVRFLDTGYEVKTNTSNIRSGRVKDKLFRSVLGVGFVGVGMHKTTENGRQSKKYRRWVNMLERCYSYSFHEKNPTYIGCTVCDEWHNFQSFGDWFDSEFTSEKSSWDIDKDILNKDSKQYSKDNCILIPQWLNKFVKQTHNDSIVGSIGVDFMKSNGKFRARCTNPENGSHEHLGLFQCEKSAHKAWLERKIYHAKSMKSKMDEIDIRIFPKTIEMIKNTK
jgi:hypothetical protein